MVQSSSSSTFCIWILFLSGLLDFFSPNTFHSIWNYHMYCFSDTDYLFEAFTPPPRLFPPPRNSFSNFTHTSKLSLSVLAPGKFSSPQPAPPLGIPPLGIPTILGNLLPWHLTHNTVKVISMSPPHIIH